eukprot:6214500-Pleurochrysis_carterae.AAC.10
MILPHYGKRFLTYSVAKPCQILLNCQKVLPKCPSHVLHKKLVQPLLAEDVRSQILRALALDLVEWNAAATGQRAAR